MSNLLPLIWTSRVTFRLDMLPFFNVLFVAVFAMDIRLLLFIIKFKEEEEKEQEEKEEQEQEQEQEQEGEEEEGGQVVLSTSKVAFFELYTQIRLT